MGLTGWLHRHDYQWEATTYAPPRDGKSEIGHMDGVAVPLMIALVSKLKFGVTTFLYRCTDTSCGDLKTVEMLGTEESHGCDVEDTER